MKDKEKKEKKGSHTKGPESVTKLEMRQNTVIDTNVKMSIEYFKLKA